MSAQLLQKNKNQLTFATSSRFYGSMSLNCADASGSLANRKAFLNEQNIDHLDLVCAKQVHGSRVRLIEKNDCGRGALSQDSAIDGIDALVTAYKNIPIAVFTADCLSVFIYDSRNQAIGLAHAGWRGTRENIVSKTINVMAKEFNSRPADMIVSFGPSIRDCCYEVGEDFCEQFSGDVKERDKKFYLDLAGANKRQLADCGILERNIFDPGICTCCKAGDFFSFRREGAMAGRQMSVMMLV
jgi:hypothetical protein